jgi:hypothetical protein
MSDFPEWLPDEIDFSKFSNFNEIIDFSYRIFSEDFIENQIYFRGLPVYLKRSPIKNGKDATFFHLITSGYSRSKRKVILKRCARISWLRKIIENSNSNWIKVWKNSRKGETRWLLWFEKGEHLIIRAERKNHYLLWTAYNMSQKHTIKKLKKEYEDSQKC